MNFEALFEILMKNFGVQIIFFLPRSWNDDLLSDYGVNLDQYNNYQVPVTETRYNKIQSVL